MICSFCHGRFDPDETFYICCGGFSCSCGEHDAQACDECWHALVARGEVDCASGCESPFHNIEPTGAAMLATAPWEKTV